MASKAQNQVDFPVRKSCRQIKAKGTGKETAYAKDCSRLRRSSRNEKKKTGLLRGPSPVQSESPCFLACQSPSKRKSALSSPPTPPKSPCKSPKAATSARSLSPVTCSATSASSTVVRITTSEAAGRLSPNKCHRELLSPSRQKLQPPFTPPQSPFTSSLNGHSKRQELSPTLSSCMDTLCCKTPVSSPKRKACERVDSSPSNIQSVGSRCVESTEYIREVGSSLAKGQRTPTTPRKFPITPRRLFSQTEVDGVSESSTLSSAYKSPEKKTLINLSDVSLGTPKLSSPQKVESRSGALSPTRNATTKANDENLVFMSPRKLVPLIMKPDGIRYQKVKQCLHTAKPANFVGRDQEMAGISSFLKKHLEQSSAGSLYISGAPGTGKTAALLHVVDNIKAEYQCRIAYLNCMLVKDASYVFKKLHSELSSKPFAGKNAIKDMEKLVTSNKESIIVVLDEIDQLDSKNQDVLYHIFEWPSLSNSKIILIGVANALDLTDRILPRLQAKPQCRPQLIHFAPYTRDQITNILKSRLSEYTEVVVESSAIQFCARKISAVAGDMRKALDVCRRAVELVESETRTQAILKISDRNSPSKIQAGALKMVSVSHISKVISEVYGSSVQSHQSEAVPLQQKLVVCTLLLVVKSGKFKEILLGKLHETYCKVCKRQQMTPVDQSEFHSLCVLLDARGIISIRKAKETRLIKVTLRQDEKELEQTLQDRILVSSILREGLPK